MPIEVIGYAATTIICISLLPQVFKAWKTKSTKDLSIPWLLIYVIGLVLWIIYGAGIQSHPLIISASVETVIAISLLVLKLIYK